MMEKFHPKDCIQDEEKMGFKTPLDGGFPFHYDWKGNELMDLLFKFIGS
jgi:hypothetical protein